ncbi:MAG: SufD family Fe-S cluster assembly protein [Clostridia bacterium]|nr:SufD family Fe-S cluster assembly protein [Clostridia bacterium]
MSNEIENKLDAIEMNLLKSIADIEKTPMGAYNIRENGKGIARQTTSNIDIVTKQDKPGIDIIIKPNTKNESVHIPVILTQGGFNDVVYNDFYVGENADVVIVAGCGIHNTSCETSQHDGIHTFHLGKGSKVKYIEKHYGEGDGTGDKVLNPQTIVYLEDGSNLEMETVQIKGVTSTVRETKGELGPNSNLLITERIMTAGKQTAKTIFNVDLNGENSSVRVASRSIARDNSTQEFISNVNGNTKCFGHVECDAIIMDKAKVISTPQIIANHIDASLIHEAAIGKIAGDQIIKLMSLGLTESEAEEQIINGFLK